MSFRFRIAIDQSICPVGVTRQLTPNLLEKPTIPQLESTDRANITDQNNGRSYTSMGIYRSSV